MSPEFWWARQGVGTYPAHCIWWGSPWSSPAGPTWVREDDRGRGMTTFYRVTARLELRASRGYQLAYHTHTTAADLVVLRRQQHNNRFLFRQPFSCAGYAYPILVYKQTLKHRIPNMSVEIWPSLPPAQLQPAVDQARVSLNNHLPSPPSHRLALWISISPWHCRSKTAGSSFQASTDLPSSC